MHLRSHRENLFVPDERNSPGCKALEQSGLLGWAFRPRTFMKNWHYGKGRGGEVGLTVKKSRSLACLTLEHAALLRE